MTGSRANRSHLRLFAALDLPGEVRRLASAWGREAARNSNGVRAVPAANCHVTLAFLGDRLPVDLPLIAGAIEAATSSPAPMLSLGAPVSLPRRRPRALALEVHDGDGTLRELQVGLAGSLEAAIGWRPERAFRPHLTAVRLGRGSRAGGRELPVTPAVEFRADSVSLYSSRLTPEGAEYEALETVAFNPV